MIQILGILLVAIINLKKENTVSDSKQTAIETIAAKLHMVEELLQDCQIIADEAEVNFEWDGPEYGMGGYYSGKLQEWSSSSQNC